MKIVVDTNILVSGLLSPFGPPGRIVAGIAAGNYNVCYTTPILAEYEAVLRRAAFGFNPHDVAALLDEIQAEGELFAPAPTAIALPDMNDVPFLEAAIAAHADYLITGNLRHFPAAARRGIEVVSPAQFIRRVQGSAP